MIYPMNNTMTKRLAALAWVMLLANVFLPTGVAFAEEGAPIVSEQVKSQETEKVSNEQWEVSQTQSETTQTQTEATLQAENPAQQGGGGETVSTSASSQAQQENQEKKAEVDSVQTKALEESSTQAQPMGMSTFRKIPDAYQRFIPDELKDQVDVFYGSSGNPHVVWILSTDRQTIDVAATKAHPIYSSIWWRLRTNLNKLGEHKILEIEGLKVLFKENKQVFVNEPSSILSSAFKWGQPNRSAIIWSVDLSKVIWPYGNTTSFKKSSDAGYNRDADKYNEVKKDGVVIGYTIKTDDSYWIYAPVYKTETFYTSNGNAFEVIVDDNGDVNLAKNKEVVDKKYPGDQDLIDAVKWIQKAEILEIDGKKVLFVQMQGGETKAFVNEANSNLKDAFKTQWAQDMTPLLVPDLTQAVKASWVDTTKVVKKYNEIKSGTATIGYTFHNEANDWFFAPATKKEVKSFYTSNDVEFKVVMKSPTTVDIDATKVLFASVIPTLSAELQALANNATENQVEIRTVEGVDVLFVDLWTSTKAFFAQQNSMFKEAFKGWADINASVQYENPEKASWVDTSKAVKKYNEVKKDGVVIGYTLKNEANEWFYAKKKNFTVTPFYTSNNNPIPVVLNAAGTEVDMVGTKAVLLPLIPTITDAKLKAEAESFANTATASDVEIKEIEGVKLLFVKVGNGMKTFAATQNSMFKEAFKGWADINASVQYENPEKASWVDTSKAVKKYNEVKKDGVVIGYTLKNEANEWFYAKKTQYTPAHRGGGWGGSSSSVSSSSVTTWTTSSVNTWVNQPVKPKVEVRNYSWDTLPSLCSAEGSSFSEEQNHAYLWACGKDITTIRAISGARLDQPLTRAELAKMMSVYVTKVLGKQPVLTGVAQYPDVDSKMGDLADYIQLAYQLQIMGIHHDGTALSHFEPNKFVTRAEFATVFSRVLYGAKYNQDGKDWAKGHLNALKEAGILKNITPNMLELRGRVLLMLQRSTVAK